MGRQLVICEKEIRVQGRFLRIASLEADKYQFVDDPEPIIDRLRRCRERIDLFTFLQRLPETQPKYSYPMEMDNLAAIPLTTFDHWWTKQIGFKARNKARQAEKRGVVLREVPFDERLVKGIWEVYNECPVRQGVPFRHYGKDLQTVYREEATFLESSTFIGAFFEDRMIGFVKLVYDETRIQAGLMNIVSMISHRDKAPTNALIAQSVQSCVERGVRYLVYSNFAYGKKQSSSISDFKERNGFQRIDLPRYYVPLSVIGSAAFRLGFHKKLRERVPESVASKLRKVREVWYSRKVQAQADAS